MTFTDAAAEVLRLVGKPLHYKEITDIAIEKNLLSHVGKSPEVTMGARLAATLKKDSGDNPLVRVKPGVFALREWDEKTLKAGADGKKGKKGAKPEGKRKDDEPEEAFDEVDAPTEDAPPTAGAAAPAGADEEGDDDVDEAAVTPRPAAVAAARPSAPRMPFEDEDDGEPPAPDEAMRAEAVAGAAEIFDEEEDDDQPILGGADDRGTGPASGPELGDGRRRRRRRRRGRGSDRDSERGGAGASAGGGLPSYTATPAFEPRADARGDSRGDSRGDNRDSRGDNRGDNRGDRGPSRPIGRDEAGEPVYRGPQVIELTGGDGHALDDLAGRELSDAIAAILSTFDRNAGAVSLRQIAETAQRRGRLAGDAQLAQSQIAAAVRADNHRRLVAGQRPRFRFAGGRVALTDWLLAGDLARLEQEALAAVERYREGARRAFARKLGELPGHAFVEVCVLALERIGMGQLRAVRRAGSPGGETHFSGLLRAAGDEVKAAIVIRRDGREVGRERVTELRGSLHHYGPAAVGWILTAGQMLSGAREEAGIAGTAPVALFDGLAVARLCEDNDVGVLRARLPIAIPDVDFLEALRAS